jgi:NAD-dependent protein deacetylases, SIR2 family
MNALEIVSQSIKSKKLAVFCGAGISRNSGLPTVSDIVTCILKRLGLNKEEIEEIMANAIPFEAFMELLDDNSDISPILNIYGLGEPNTNHIFIAKLAKNGFINTIYTTNFDLLIEKALENEGLKENIDFKVYYREEDFDDIDTIFENGDSNFIRLFKIHGSVRVNSNTIDLVSIRTTIKSVSNKALSDQRKNAIRHLFSSGKQDTVLVMGYSCSDILDINVYINSIKNEKNLKKVVYLKHGAIEGEFRNDEFDKDIASFNDFKINEYPFKSFLGKILIKNTDDFVKELWRNVLDSGNDIKPEFKHHVDYLKYINEWIEVLSESALKDLIIGRLFAAILDYKKSIEYYEKNLKIIKNPNNEPYNMDTEYFWKYRTAVCYLSLGMSNYEINEDTSAIKYFKKSAELFLDIKHKKGIAKCLSCLGGIYFKKGNNPHAIDCFEKSLEINVETHNRKEIANCYASIGACHFELGNLDETIANYQKAEQVCKNEGYMDSLALCHTNLGATYGEKGDLEKAMEKLDESLKISLYLGNKQRIAHNYQNIGVFHRKMGNFKEAIEANESIQEFSNDIYNEYISSKYFFDIGMLYFQKGFRKLLFNSEKVSATSISKENTSSFLNKWFSLTPGEYGSLEDIEMAIQNLNKSLLYVKDDDLKEKKEIYSTLAFAYIISCDIKNSVDANQKSLTICEKLNDKEGIAKCHDFYRLLLVMQKLTTLNLRLSKKCID